LRDAAARHVDPTRGVAGDRLAIYFGYSRKHSALRG